MVLRLIFFTLLIPSRSSDLNKCLSILASSSQSVHNPVTQYSGRGLNHQGKPESCQNHGLNYFTLSTADLVKSLNVHLGLCLPSECSTKVLEPHIKKLNLNIEEPAKFPLSLSGSIFLFSLLSLVFICLFCTLTEFCYPNLSSHKFIKIFSSMQNFREFMKNRENKEYYELAAFDGIRVLGFLLVIYGHIVLFKPVSSLVNIEELEGFLARWTGTFVHSSYYAVDSFFLISGFFMSFLLMNELERRDGKAWLWAFVLRRVFRILPLLLVVLGINFFVVPWMTTGPIWSRYYNIFCKGCPDYWWSTALFINNFYPSRGPDQCYKITWYISNDMQFFITGTLLTYTYHSLKHKNLIWLLSILTFITLFGLTYKISEFHDLSANSFDSYNQDKDGTDRWFKYYYIRPYIRFPSYLQGILLGFIYFSHKNKNKSIQDSISSKIIKILKSSKLTQFFILSFGLFLMCHSVQVQEPLYNHLLDSHIWPIEKNSLVLAYTRFSFTFGLALILVLVLFGKLPLLCRILSARCLALLGKLTYPGYLCHAMIVLGFQCSLHDTFINTGFVLKEFVVYSFLTFVLAFFLHLFVEAPINQLVNQFVFGYRKRG